MSNAELIYLDNAATTFPKPESVYQAMDQFYRSYGGNAGRGGNPLARKAASLVHETRELLKLWLSAPEVAFSPSATLALNTAILGADLGMGDVVYVSPFEHNSVLRPLAHLRKAVGIEVRVLPFDKQTFACALDDVRKQFRIDPPAMLCISQVSNVFGAVLPVDELSLLAKQANARAIVLVDGAQAAGLLLPTMERIDALIFSGHKSLYGPFGIAGLAFGTRWRPQPIFFGGTGTQSDSLDMPAQGMGRYEAGSQNIVAVAGLHAALLWLHEQGREHLQSHLNSLTHALVSALQSIPQATVYTPQQQSGIVSFTLEGISPQAIETALGAKNIAVRAGLHCAPWSHEWAGTLEQGGTVRVSGGWFSSEKEAAHLFDSLKAVV
ncbi:MAG: aminotransferase class V-fold PLP-dependent enzyme [Anaerolineae bacterium]|nr:aminotransferase class V-fold PLP-dependent enzyme [Anaerolineae bacterium]MDW8172087.1 aminotransferase class V-fold PLP-dependent enzyme [Anaerolineae bacterium]